MKLHEIQIWAPINNILLKHREVHFIYILTMAAFLLQRQSWIVATEPVWPGKPKIFTNWLCSEKKKIADQWSKAFVLYKAIGMCSYLYVWAYKTQQLVINETKAELQQACICAHVYVCERLKIILSVIKN